jgi:hypothetical protein
MEKRVDVFFYGLFMDANMLRTKGVHPLNLRQARVDGAALRLGERATLVPEVGASVHGILMSLAHSELDRLYSEPSVSAYRPEPVLAILGGREGVPALCFNLPDAPNEFQPNMKYAAKLRATAERLGLPADYIAKIGRPPK